MVIKTHYPFQKTTRQRRRSSTTHNPLTCPTTRTSLTINQWRVGSIFSRKPSSVPKLPVFAGKFKVFPQRNGYAADKSVDVRKTNTTQARASLRTLRYSLESRVLQPNNTNHLFLSVFFLCPLVEWELLPKVPAQYIGKPSFFFRSPFPVASVDFSEENSVF